MKIRRKEELSTEIESGTKKKERRLVELWTVMNKMKVENRNRFVKWERKKQKRLNWEIERVRKMNKEKEIEKVNGEKETEKDE